MLKLCCGILLITCNMILSISVNVDPQKAYGDFDVILKRFEFCKGPKIRDCSTGTINLDNETSAAVTLIVKENIVLSRGKVITSSTAGAENLRLLLSKPCENWFLKPLLQAMFNFNSKCEIPKGDYQFHLNFKDMVQRYYGGKHFYGSWHFKALFYSNDCNFVCTHTVIQLIPVHN